jgi:hypothetical protein
MTGVQDMSRQAVILSTQQIYRAFGMAEAWQLPSLFIQFDCDERSLIRKVINQVTDRREVEQRCV